MAITIKQGNINNLNAEDPAVYPTDVGAVLTCYHRTNRSVPRVCEDKRDPTICYPVGGR